VQESLFLTDHVGVTALHAAVQSARSEDTARALLEGGADVNARTHKGNTPLLFAANAGHHGAAEMLLAAGAAANAQNAADVGVLNKPINQASKNHEGTRTPEESTTRQSVKNHHSREPPHA
jgi:ankyrin repeat protein